MKKRQSKRRSKALITPFRQLSPNKSLFHLKQRQRKTPPPRWKAKPRAAIVRRSRRARLQRSQSSSPNPLSARRASQITMLSIRCGIVVLKIWIPQAAEATARRLGDAHAWNSRIRVLWINLMTIMPMIMTKMMIWIASKASSSRQLLKPKPFRFVRAE